MPVFRCRLPLFTAVLALAAAGAATAADVVREIVLTPQQLQSAGLRSVAAASAAQGGTRYPGSVVVPPRQQRVVAAPLAGLVLSVAVSAGDTVRAGQLLAVIQSPQARELQAEWNVSRLQAEQAELTLARDEQLFREGLIPQARLEASRMQVRLAATQRDERRAALLQAAADGGLIRLTAPIGGVVLERSASVGQRLETAAPLLRLAQLSPLWLELQVPVAEAAALRVGAAVTVDGQPGTGRVIAHGAVVDATAQTVTVRAELPGGTLKPGQAVEARVAAGDGGGRPLPPAAVLREGGRSFVFVEIGAGRFAAQPVQVRRSTADAVLVSGLPPQARVVVAGTASLKALLAQPS